MTAIDQYRTRYLSRILQVCVDPPYRWVNGGTKDGRGPDWDGKVVGSWSESLKVRA